MDRRGLTLLETLLALTILSMAGAVVYSSLATTLFSWRTGVSRGRDRQVALVALDRIAGQLKSAVPAVVRSDSGTVAAFDGGENFVRFVTLLPVSGRPVAQVSYSIEQRGGGRMLVYREHPWPDKEFAEGGGDPWLEEEVPEITGMSVLLMTREGGAESEGPDAERAGTEWQAGEKEELPDEVEVSFQIASDTEEESLFRTVVPVMAGPFSPGRQGD